MLFTRHNQTVLGRQFIRFGVAFILLCLVTPWAFYNRDTLPLPFGDRRKLPSDDSYDPALLSPSIRPFRIELPALSDNLKLQLPPHCAKRWGYIHKVFTNHNPGSPLNTSVEHAGEAEYYEESWETCKRPNVVHLASQHVVRAQKTHEAFLTRLPALARAFTFAKASRGIVTTANGALMPVLLVSLRLLRRTGCTLPVQVFLATLADYEPLLCEKVLPSLNAHCVILGDNFLDITPPAGKPYLASYQIKPFVLLLSSFNQVLFLDVDNFPVTNPGLLFDSEPFLSTGLVIWPDLWCASQSRFFYHITGAPETPLSERPASESGQIMYDKSRHVEDLLLACYYSYYGPGLYYPLLSQGYPGEGDKETYIVAAQIMNKTFYQARQLPGMLPDDFVVDFAIQQVNPAADYAAMQAGKTWQEAPSPHAFIHHHYPKLNALQMMQREDYEWAKGAHGRMWGPAHETVAMYGLDLEHEVWKAINYTACDLENMFLVWQGQNSSCQFVQEHMRLVFKDDP